MKYATYVAVIFALTGCGGSSEEPLDSPQDSSFKTAPPVMEVVVPETSASGTSP